MSGPIKLALVDDHVLFRKGLASLIESFVSDAVIIFEADNGLEMQKRIDTANLPDIILMDVNMPGLNGFESVKWLNQHFPQIKILVVSMIEKEEVITGMLKLGVKGYLCKDVEPKELGEALRAIHQKGFYYTDFITGKLVLSIQRNEIGVPRLNQIEISDQEMKFLQLACSELTYNEIADRMFLSPKTIDGYRGSLFEKFGVKSRVGMALYALKQGLVNL